jgi:hypothetical protein
VKERKKLFEPFLNLGSILYKKFNKEILIKILTKNKEKITFKKYFLQESQFI